MTAPGRRCCGCCGWTRRSPLPAPTVRLLDAGTDGMAVMFAAQGLRHADHRRCLPLRLRERRGVRGAGRRAWSSRRAPVSTCMISAGTMRCLPGGRFFASISRRTVTVFLIEAENARPWHRPCPTSVSAATRKVAGRIREIVAARSPAMRRPGVSRTRRAAWDQAAADLSRRARPTTPFRRLRRRHPAAATRPISWCCRFSMRHRADMCLKIRNAAGDRVVDAGDFFRDHGIEDGAEWHGSSTWCEADGGLRLYEVFLM